MLADNIKNPKDELNRITPADVASANYDNMGLKPNDNAAHSIGLFLEKERYADACKYYIDLVNDDDLGEARNYINSVYDILSFKNQAVFVSMAKNLVELKVLNRVDEAADEFASYALCSRDIAKQVIDMI